MTYIYWQVMEITPWGKRRKQNESDVLEMMEESVARFGYRMTLFYRHQGCLGVQVSQYMGSFRGNDWQACTDVLHLAFTAHGSFPP